MTLFKKKKTIHSKNNNNNCLVFEMKDSIKLQIAELLEISIRVQQNKKNTTIILNA